MDIYNTGDIYLQTYYVSILYGQHNMMYVNNDHSFDLAVKFVSLLLICHKFVYITGIFPILCLNLLCIPI